MKFTKMHGLGNDYIYINAITETVDNPEQLAVQMSRRHYGIGADGLILIKQSDIADFKMEMYNADGSSAQMCGNGIRCVAKYVYDKKLTEKTDIRIETKAGVKQLFLEVHDDVVKMVTVIMGQPQLRSSRIPVISKKEIVKDEELEIDGEKYRITCVSMGNPHAVVFVEDIRDVNLEEIGRKIENHPMFPEKTNVEFVEVITNNIIRMRVWERGTGSTLACGTGACASVVASVMNGFTERRVDVILDGGILTVDWRESSNIISMRGPAEMVFEGNYMET
ncbi:diaminopimelate epimerase [Anaerosporobacter sp.]|uniref:diaminopimelate epimerase n=1 Tax=Anaerosporobacter sp. TaxID=1872529 RepID=UPI00286EE658|nr:diaminopimelate epimerase [Anaerosporobacter sp.]